MGHRNGGFILAAALALIVSPAAAAQELPGGWTSDNVEYVGNFALAGEVAEGGRLVGSTFFATANARGFVVLDVSEPEHPVELSTVRLPHLAENEDIATNGEILLFSQASAPTYSERAALAYLGLPSDASRLYVFDVRDPAAPRQLAVVEGAGDHTYTCLLDCRWAYGASGLIVDLRDPARPVVLTNAAGEPKLWTSDLGLTPPDPITGLPRGNPAHDLSEVAPGFLLSASTPMILIDARDPADPKPLAKSPVTRNTFHNNVWRHAPGGRLALTVSEAYINPRCETRDITGEIDSAVRSWDMTNWRQTGTFTPLHDYYLQNGAYADGDPAFSQSGIGGCSAHWVDVHPRFGDGGLFAAASYGHGAKFVRVASDGSFEEVGHFLGYAANVSAVYWINDEIVYTVDMHRGIDILRFTGDTAPGAGRRSGSDSWIAHRPPTREEVARAARQMGPEARLATIYCLLGRV